MKVLITGADGFLGRNLQVRLAERKDVVVLSFTRQHQPSELHSLVDSADFVFHLAGINRPQDPKEFTAGNVDLTRSLCEHISSRASVSGVKVPVVFSSSIQAGLDNAYGLSKRAAEEELFKLSAAAQVPVYVYRLPNVFGKWSRPNYNSVVATFCYNVAHDLAIRVNDQDAPLTLVYVDDVVDHFVALLDESKQSGSSPGFVSVVPEYRTTVGALADEIRAFKSSRATLMTERVGTGLTRALYATYLSHLPPGSFSYSVPQYADPRGVFVEMLKTPDCGQFSYFTAHPGVTRGGHYHHTKTEKFLVLKGKARFRFRHVVTGEVHELSTAGEKPEIVETVPGWTHDITNIGADEMVVMLWANEVFDRSRPDTITRSLEP